MIEHSLRVLSQLPPDKSPALPLRQVEEANVALNSLYLNLRGALDNTAWAVTYRFPLVDEPSENNRRHRSFVSLFGSAFLKALSEKDPELSERLESLATWGRELATFRDPAAHRIPLYIPPSVVDEEGVTKIHRLDAEMAAAAEADDWEAFHSKMMEQWNAGTYRAWVTLSEQEGLKMVWLAALINRDLAGLLDALESVIAFIFAEGIHPLATNCSPLPKRTRRLS
jgi:hypothetical protein